MNEHLLVGNNGEVTFFVLGYLQYLFLWCHFNISLLSQLILFVPLKAWNLGDLKIFGIIGKILAWSHHHMLPSLTNSGWSHISYPDLRWGWNLTKARIRIHVRKIVLIFENLRRGHYASVRILKLGRNFTLFQIFSVPDIQGFILIGLWHPIVDWLNILFGGVRVLSILFIFLHDWEIRGRLHIRHGG